ncbi:MAG: lipopolysaccharide heptosyltransferase II [Chlamydiota bacterium]
MLQCIPKNIIIRMPNWIVDFVMATTILPEIRKKFPSAKITAMCKDPLGSLLQKDPNIDELFCFHKPTKNLFQRKERKSIIEKLKMGQYDLGILLTNSFSSAWWFWLGQVKYRLGYQAHFRKLLLNLPVPFPKTLKNQHQILSYKMLLESLDIPVTQTKPYLYISADEVTVAKKLLTQRGYEEGFPLVGMHASAAYGKAKCWPQSKFQELAKKLLEENPSLYIVFFGDSFASSTVKEIVASLSERAINLAGKTSLRDLGALLRSCKVFLTNDSGPMHMAAALQVPTVALFGSTSDILTGPEYGEKAIVINKKVSCSPCFKRECVRDFLCMKSIDVEEVLSHVKSFLKDG